MKSIENMLIGLIRADLLNESALNRLLTEEECPPIVREYLLEKRGVEPSPFVGQIKIGDEVPHPQRVIIRALYGLPLDDEKKTLVGVGSSTNEVEQGFTDLELVEYLCGDLRSNWVAQQRMGFGAWDGLLFVAGRRSGKSTLLRELLRIELSRIILLGPQVPRVLLFQTLNSRQVRNELEIFREIVEQDPVLRESLVPVLGAGPPTTASVLTFLSHSRAPIGVRFTAPGEVQRGGDKVFYDEAHFTYQGEFPTSAEHPSLFMAGTYPLSLERRDLYHRTLFEFGRRMLTFSMSTREANPHTSLQTLTSWQRDEWAVNQMYQPSLWGLIDKKGVSPEDLVKILNQAPEPLTPL